MKTDNQIQLHRKQNELQNQKNEESICGILSLLVFLGGLCLLLRSALPSANVSWWMLFAVSAIFGVVSLLLYSGRLKSWILPAGCVLLMLFCLLTRHSLTEAAGNIMHDLTDALSHINGRIYLDYTASQTALAALLPLLLFCTLLCGKSIASGKIWAVLPVIFATGAGGICGILPMGIGWLLFTAGIVLVLGGCLTKQVFSRMITVLLCTALALGISALLLDWDSDAWQGKLRSALHAAQYERSETSMPEGQLDRLGLFEKNNTPALSVTMESPQKLYLRGSVYDTYTGRRWEALSAQIRGEESDLFYWLHESSFFGQSQIAYATSLTGETTAAALHIEVLGACRGHAYLPYGLASNDLLDAAVIGDAQTKNTSSDYLYLPGSLPTWYALQHTLSARQNEAEINDYLDLERAYADYIYRADLQITEESRAVIQRQLGDLEDSYTLSEIQTIIRSYLTERLRYDESTVTNLNGGDFLHATLETGDSGYSVHYATTAVLMLRYFGVPARYVEGYYLSAADAEKLTSGEEIILTGQNAHAWAEYYLEGVGFVPFEVTPGYIDPEDLHAGGIDSSALGTSYSSEKLSYAVSENPEPEGGQQGLHHFKSEHLSYLLLLPPLLFAAWVCRKRILLASMLQSFRKEENRQAVKDWYGYAMLLQKYCPISLQDDAQAELLNREAQFSNHCIDGQQRKQMETYAQDTVKAVKDAGSFLQKLQWRWINGIL